MPHPVPMAAVASYPNINPDGDQAIANALPNTLPAIIDAWEWDTLNNTERVISLATGRATGAAAASAPAWDPHVQQGMQVVIADKRNPVIGSYASRRNQAYAAAPLPTTPGYQVADEFKDDRTRKFFKLPSSTPAEQALIGTEYAALIADPQTSAIVNSVIGPPVYISPSQHLAHVVARQQGARARYFLGHRAAHHQYRSAVRTQAFYQDVDQHLQTHPVTRSIGTEMRGEVAATEYLIAETGYELKMAFSGQGHTGIDQIWVKRLHGDITEYMIVEAKGSYNAKLQQAQKGMQMSARWVYVSLMEMVRAGAHVEMARKILAAIHRRSAVTVNGRMIKCKYKPGVIGTAAGQHTLIYHGYDDYNVQWI